MVKQSIIFRAKRAIFINDKVAQNMVLYNRTDCAIIF